MLEFLLSPEIWIAFFTLTALELVLGIDNIIFISILVDKLPKEKQELARRIGLFLAMFMRIGAAAGAVVDRRPDRAGADAVRLPVFPGAT
jgi:predicted tellurium resistance membrane protein TerC